MGVKKEEKKTLKVDKTEKISKFALKLSELRRERGISQKKAATDLGISQALLSHYEKGIRECGLDFVIRCSEYYGVTTDYLLGVSDSRNGLDIDALNKQDEEDDEFSIFTLGKATKYLLDLVATGSDEGAQKYISDYYTLCVYRGAITLAKAGMLPKEMFKLDYTLGRELASAALSVEDAKFVFIEDKSRPGSDLAEKTAIHRLIEKAEDIIYNTFVLELSVLIFLKFNKFKYNRRRNFCGDFFKCRVIKAGIFISPVADRAQNSKFNIICRAGMPDCATLHFAANCAKFILKHCF